MSEPAPVYRFDPKSGNYREPGELWYQCLGRLWEALHDLSSVLVPMRFSIVVLVVGAVLLIFVHQSQDALLVLVASASAGFGEPIVRLLIFVVGAWVWAFNSFYAARLMSRLPPRGRALLVSSPPDKDQGGYLFPPPLIHRRHIKWLNYHAPHGLGALVIVVVTAAAARAIWGVSHWSAMVILITGVVALLIFRALVRRRLDMISWFGNRVGNPRGLQVEQQSRRDLRYIVTIPPYLRYVVDGAISNAATMGRDEAAERPAYRAVSRARRCHGSDHFVPGHMRRQCKRERQSDNVGEFKRLVSLLSTGEASRQCGLPCPP